MADDGTAVPKHEAEWGNYSEIYGQILYGGKYKVAWIFTRRNCVRDLETKSA